VAHLPRLDGVRGLAILLVLLYHFVYDGFPPALTQSAVAGVLAWGWVGVDLFFVLSGFLITGLLLDSRDSPRYFLTFYGRRFLRIIPLYFVFLSVYVTALLLLGPTPHDLERLSRSLPFLATFTTNLAVAATGTFSVLPPYTGMLWSLAVEEQFYLLWPFLILLVPPRRLLAVCGGLVVAALVVRVALVWSGAPWIAAYVLMPARMDTLALGSAVAVLWRQGRLSDLSSLAPLAGAACVVSLFALTRAGFTFESGPPVMPTLGYTLLALLCTCGLVSSLTSSWSLTDARWLQGLGTYAYGLYLWHELVRLTLNRWRWEPSALDVSPWLAVGLYASVGLGASILLAVVSWHGFEAPINRLKRFLPVGTNRARPSALLASVE
jgi:peptidoglycan/LPS O-acetylase OafA/YrhL